MKKVTYLILTPSVILFVTVYLLKLMLTLCFGLNYLSMYELNSSNKLFFSREKRCLTPISQML